MTSGWADFTSPTASVSSSGGGASGSAGMNSSSIETSATANSGNWPNKYWYEGFGYAWREEFFTISGNGGVTIKVDCELSAGYANSATDDSIEALSRVFARLEGQNAPTWVTVMDDVDYEVQGIGSDSASKLSHLSVSRNFLDGDQGSFIIIAPSLIEARAIPEPSALLLLFPGLVGLLGLSRTRTRVRVWGRW